MRFVSEFIESNYKAGCLRGSFRGSVLFLDIAGFTSLTERAFSRGEGGAELINQQLRRLFDLPVRVVIARGGIITRFAGDAFTTLFPDDKGERAWSSALAVIEFFKAEGQVFIGDEDFNFSVKCGIAC